MQVKFKHESDGICFAKRFQECLVVGNCLKGCNTYACPFYKPCGCEDWIKIERQQSIAMIPPEEARVKGTQVWQ